MSRTVRHALMGVVVLAALAALPLRAAEELTLDGMYLSEGTNPDGSKYNGLVHIARNGDSFVVSWLAPRPERDRVRFQTASVGVGIMSSDMLSVSYYAPKGSGIVVYRIEELGHRLAGRWTVAGNDGAVHSETLTKLPPSQTEGLGLDLADEPVPAAPPVRDRVNMAPGTRVL